MKMLASATAATAVTLGVLYFVPAPKPPSTAIYDKIEVIIIGATFLAVALVMVVSRKVWTPRAIGLLFSFLSLGILFTNATYVRVVGYHLVSGPDGSVKPVPNTDPGKQEFISDLSRSLLIIGGPLLLTGAIVWLIGRYRTGHTYDLDDEVAERRHIVRREEDRIMRARLAELEAQR
jgi:hypothetical protein